MGTHSLIRFKQCGRTIVAVYQQYDGYPEGVGLQLAGFLRSRRLCNGIPVGDAPPSPATHWANGVGCMAAQFVVEFKKQAGGLYLHHPDSPDERFGWTYEVDTDDGMVAVIAGGAEQFRGDVEHFAQFCQRRE
jgi:hypothetical protein